MKKHLSLLLSILILTIILFNNLSVYAFSSYTTDPIDTSTLNDLTQITEVSEDPYSAFIDDSYYNITNDYLTTIINKLSSLPPSGNPCIDYLGEEILLHRAILFISHIIQGYTSNPELIDITDDIIENYTGELKEMRIELAKLIDNSKKNNSSKFDDSYYKEFNPIANKLSTDFSKISSKDSNDLTYIKEVLILLQASHDIADIDSICTNNDLVSKISKNSLTNTSGYISRLTTLKNSIK